jgi:hypothetical protein
MAYQLYIKDSAKLIGTLTDEQLDELIELLEEEGAEDHDYYIDQDVLAFMEEEGADEELLAMLRPHVSEDDGIEVEWKEDRASKTP